MNEQEMAVKLAEVDARSKSNTHRLDEMDEKVDTLNRLATAVEVMAAIFQVLQWAFLIFHVF